MASPTVPVDAVPPGPATRRARGAGARALVGRVAARSGPLRTLLGPVTSLGWTLALIAAVSWYLGARLQWAELLILAGACLVALTVAVLLTIGRLAVDIEVRVDPPRLEVDQEAVGSVRATNPRSRPSLGTRLEIPVGGAVHPVDIGVLGAGASREELFLVPTHRRAIIPIGPARSVKGDPLGIARREVSSGEQVLLHVHPRTTLFPALTAGWMRDLEGQTTNDLSTSDVAFHTLREYQPGDDRRHIHWRTTARLGTMMVRQFVDTRRSHLGLVLSTDASDWAGDDEFELGVSVLGSLGRTALYGDQEVTTVSGSRPLASHTPDQLLDGLSGVEREPDGLALRDLVRRSLAFTRGVSVLTLVIGSTIDPRLVRAACGLYRADVEVLAVQCRLDVEASRRRIGNVSLIEVGRLQDLARVLAVVGAR